MIYVGLKLITMSTDPNHAEDALLVSVALNIIAPRVLAKRERPTNTMSHYLYIFNGQIYIFVMYKR